MNYKKITIFLFAFCCLIFINHLKAFGQTANFRFVLEERLAKAEIYKNGKKKTGIRLDEVFTVDPD
jgi:hypothetical protein